MEGLEKDSYGVVATHCIIVEPIRAIVHIKKVRNKRLLGIDLLLSETRLHEFTSLYLRGAPFMVWFILPSSLVRSHSSTSSLDSSPGV